ncbi:SRPBCC domain-containing protein [Paenibacillus sp. HJL G12]|uniref:SRPBCC domain-containing protein n=1 Tax=Paenibacillus dendrobii TaxID=2691084 RepID=A0A7X3IHR4_9BACL|nr:SRPBCC domain-containing protein [Paenibacillus dendrobii]MWV43753.1 SRPBCC domain-containing protein [Paenibacillus dendrobii]
MSNQVEFVITRTVNAPSELVFKVFTKPEHLKKWWGNKGFEMNVTNLDHLRPGGRFHFNQKSPDGKELWGKFVYREVVEPEDLVFINSFSDEEGNTIRAPFHPTYPLEILNTLKFREQEGKTTITMRVGPWSATEEELKTFEGGLESAQKAFAVLFDRLEDYLASVVSL